MKRALVVAVVLFGLGFGAIAAWSYITAPGSGTGVATTPVLEPVSIDATVATPSTPLLPGESGDVTFKLDNPNATAVTLTAAVGAGSISVSNAPGCSPVNDGVSFTDQTGLSVVVPAHASGFVVDLASAATMATSSANACQGATFDIPIDVTVQLG